MPLPRLDEFLENRTDAGSRPALLRQLDLFELYLEGHPPQEYDPAQSAWFSMFLDGRGVAAGEKAEILETARSYREFLGAPDSPGTEASPPSEIANRFKPGPSVGPPPKTRPVSGKRTIAPAHNPARSNAGGWVAPLVMVAALVWGFYWGIIKRPLDDFELDITERLRRNSVAMSPSFGTWVLEEAERSGIEIIPEQSAKEILAVRDYRGSTEHMYAVRLTVAARLKLPAGLHWPRKIQIETETYLVPADWPPPKPASAKPLESTRKKSEVRKISRVIYEPALDAMEGARTNAVSFYADNPDETRKLLLTETDRIASFLASLPETNNPEEAVVRTDLKSGLEQLRGIRVILDLYLAGKIDARFLRQSVDTYAAQCEYFMRKADSRLYSEP